MPALTLVCLSSCPPGAQRVPWLGRPFMSHDQLFVVLRVSGFLVTLLPGFFCVWIFTVNMSVSLQMPRVLLRAEVRQQPMLWCLAHRPLSFLFRIIKLRRVN